MDKLLTNLFISIINSADNIINYAFENLVKICFDAETYLTEILSVQVLDFTMLKSVVLNFAIALIILKCIKKGVTMYISQTEGNSETPTHIFIMYFVRSLVIALVFPFVYDVFVNVFSDFANQIINSLNLTYQEGLTRNLATVSAVGISTAIMGVIELVLLILLYIQMLMRGVEMFVLKTSFPIFCVGLLDSNKGVFAPFIKKFFQCAFTIIIQIALAKIDILLISSSQLIMAIAVLLVALRTPKFLQEFILISGNGTSGISNMIITTSKLIELKGQLKK